MIDHFTLTVRNRKKSRAFYLKVLEPLGYELKMDYQNFSGFGDKLKPYFWIKQARPVTAPQHIAFVARTRAAVEAFHAAALAAGAKDAGEPGVRAAYHPSYYAAFVLDPDGHPIEAVCHRPAKKR